MLLVDAPKMYKENLQSHDKCLEVGRSLRDTIEAEGMSDELDQKVAKYLDRVRKTKTALNERRSPVTKMFDEIKSVFTRFENDVDINKQGTIPAELSAMRNKYAQQKLREAEERRLEEEKRLRLESAKKQYPLDVEEWLKQKYSAFLDRKIGELTQLNLSVTLENYEQVKKHIEDFPTVLSLNPDISNEDVTTELDNETARQLRIPVVAQCNSRFLEQYRFEVESNKENILDMLPSKKQELENIAKAGDEEAARRLEEIKRRDQEEAARLEAERKAKEEEAARKLEAEKATVKIGELFGKNAAVAATTYQPKVAVKKKIVVNDPRGILEIVNLWWASEGSNLSVDDLCKKFKSQITFCEKLANKANPETIDSSFITYIDEVKAK